MEICSYTMESYCGGHEKLVKRTRSARINTKLDDVREEVMKELGLPSKVSADTIILENFYRGKKIKDDWDKNITSKLFRK